MGNWINNNGFISFLSNENPFIPTAVDFLNNKGKDTFIIGNQQLPPIESSLGISISKIGLPIKIKFTLKNESVSLQIFAIKSNTEYEANFVDGLFLDYIVVENRLHFLSGDYSIFTNIFSKLNFSSNSLSLHQYMMLTQELVKDNISFDDAAFNAIEEIKESTNKFVATGLKASLFPYQDAGCNWLNFMVSNGCGCILGDEMGLGKTMQIISLFGSQKEKNYGAHFLVICPVSLLENWKREINKFYPSLSVLVHHGSNRTGDYRYLLNFDIVIMSYSNAQSDLGMLNMINWSVIVLDEAQYIKTPTASRTRTVKQLKKDVAIAVTGTPFENHVTDIWSIVDFVMPGYLGNLNSFEMNYSDDIQSAIKLEKFITPLIIRRKVKDVAKDLPQRINIPQPIIMTEREAQFYEAERKDSEKLTELRLMKIEKIQKLRMFCTHPLVYDKSLGNIDPANISYKYERLCEILENVFSQNEKAIIFTSFNEMIKIICDDIKKRYNVYTNFINGSIDPIQRQKIIDEFSSIDKPGILVLNPRAAGAGLNITAANHVIHYNLEWNPAIEDQASARAYRRGQVKTVFVHRLFYVNTIEEIINEKIQNKREISDAVIVGNNGDIDSREDLIKALSISPLNNN